MPSGAVIKGDDVWATHSEVLPDADPQGNQYLPWVQGAIQEMQPLATVGAVVAGSAVNMSSPLDLRFWPPLALAGVYAASAVLMLRPLGETVYREIAPAPAVAQADRVPVGPPAFSPSPVMAASPIEKPSIDS